MRQETKAFRFLKVPKVGPSWLHGKNKNPPVSAGDATVHGSQESDTT